jgi:hypothetical protein
MEVLIKIDSADENQATELLGLIFGRCTGGFLEIRAFNQKKTHQRFFSLPSELAQAAKFATALREDVFFGYSLDYGVTGFMW